MKVFTCNDFEGHWPVGSAAVMVATDEDSARAILLGWLHENGLPQKSKVTVVELPTGNTGIRVLVDGEY